MSLSSLWSALAQRRKAASTLADQVWVSGCNFAVGILLARMLGVEAFGGWVLLYGVLLYANTLVQACVIVPMMTLAPRADGAATRAALLRGSLGVLLAFSALLAVLVALLGSTVGASWPRWDAGPALLPLACAVFAFQCQDWLRRYFFVMGLPVRALAIDIVAYGGQLGSMLAFHAIGRLDLSATWWCIALPFLTTFAIGCAGRNLCPSALEVKAALSVLGRAGRDYLLSSQLHWIGTQGVLFVGAASLGAQAAGGVRSAQNIVGVTNIVFQALENIVPVRSATLWRERGPEAVKAYLKRIMCLAGVPLLMFFLLLSVFSGPLVRLAYGPAFEPFAVLVVWQCAYMGVAFLSRLLSYWCRTIDRSLRIAASTLASASVSVAATAVLAPRWQEHGLMLSLLLGALAALAVLAWPQRRLSL